MADREDRFLARWSRRKRDPSRDSDAVAAVPAEDMPPADAAEPGVAEPGVAEPGVAEPGVAEPGAAAEPLPDIDSLDKTSDFTVFLKEGVPEAIRRKALRRLWRSDPVLANLDGLNDYDEDFSAVGMVAEKLKTIYKVGKGYLDDDEAPGAETPGAETPGDETPGDEVPGDETPGDEVSVARTAGESSAPGKDDSGEGAGAEPATDGGPESGSPESGAPEPESPESAGPGSAAADSAPRSGKLRPGKSPRRSARNRRWGGFAS